MFTSLIQAVGHLMVKEFYTNAWEPDKEKRKPYTYTTIVSGIDISFAPSNIKRVLILRNDPPPNAVSHHERKANKDYRLEHVLVDLCIKGANWVRHKDGRPHYLRRADLEPMTKGWYDFVSRSIIPTTNRFKLTVERVVLIHSIIIGENINVEEIIADQIYKFVYKTDLSSSLPFPSIKAALCADAKVPAIKDDTLIPQQPPIMGVAMTRTRETRARNPRSIGGLTTNKKRVGRVLKPSTKPIWLFIGTERNKERMRHDQEVQEATAERAREVNKGKDGEVVPDSEEEEDSEELALSASEEW
ncbi:hypothetical protein PIB30_024050 [Stylosanthes scabra]|uniref:Putative plant transposon protein domain-containing protein n=1 Tax=Stylosanthes scabra TaxID=79078 RepID=A0ABU6R9V4_9FABA|nr:hypothetical protein [Stylosanthes scabra]